MRIAVIANEKVAGVAVAAARVAETLRELGASVTMAPDGVPFPEKVTDALLQDCDVAVALGGDGTIMHVAKRAARLDRPVLGVNCGKLGFLAGLEMSELPLLAKLPAGTFVSEKRMMLTVEAAGQTYCALNEVVLSRGSARMVDICVRDAGRQVLRYQADGVIAATPTGSTAYALSAGGPVVDPAMRCTLVTPVCPHTLYSRPYLFGENSRLELAAHSYDGQDVQLAVDAEQILSLPSGTPVTVRPSDVQATLIQCAPRAFYTVLEQKLTYHRETEEPV